MKTANHEQQKIEAYLGRLRRSLRRLRADQIDDIILELRSHILDKTSVDGEPQPDSVDAALHRLGSPEELAAAYITDSPSPWRVLDGLSRWAKLSVTGAAVLVACIVGYVLGFAFFLCAMLKPFHPQTAG